MIRNIKIQNIIDVIEISKFMEPNKCIQFFLMKMFNQMFLMVFQSSTGLEKSRCIIPSGTTQGQDCLKPIILDVKLSVEGQNIGYE